jgi:hypothetical protein
MVTVTVYLVMAVAEMKRITVYLVTAVVELMTSTGSSSGIRDR